MNKQKILIVEDEVIVALELETLLGQMGYVVLGIVDTGKKAISAITAERPDLVLMDIRIKGNLDGVETANAIQSEHHIPIVFSTADIDEEKIQRINRGIPFSYVLKPIRKRPKIAIDMAFHVSLVENERCAAEQALKAARDNLERQVEERTAELSKSNQFLVEAKQKADEANAAKSMFLANISHEFRTPMHHILNYSKFGMDKYEAAERQKLLHYFTQIRSTGVRLLNLLNDLLDLSKLESGHVTYKKHPAKIADLIEKTLEEFTQSAADRGIGFETRVETYDTVIICDEYRINQVIRNIVSNALKFTPDGKIIRVTVEETKVRDGHRFTDQRTTDGLMVSIADDGVGIPESELEQVFDKFTQSSRTVRKNGGTGLGLSICKEIIQAHRGDIWASNAPDGGSVFTFTLPRK